MYLRSCTLWKFRLLKFGPRKLKDVYRGKIRDRLSFFGLALTLKWEGNSFMKKAKKAVLECFYRKKDREDFDKFDAKVFEFHKQVKYIQKRMKDKIVTKSAKVEILQFVWERAFFELFMTASKYNDEGMKVMLKSIKKIPQ